MNRAKFAVVGHPNKGKSSIVSTLSRNDQVAISRQSGTTTQSKAYRIETAHSGYELFDTPGFQRPTKVLQWLKQHAKQADQRANAVRLFIQDANCLREFPDEVELLKPLMDGAAILYVVDGSRPFGIEYETEMEILRWTGQPSMALINPIENDNHVESWQSALSQYFKTVRIFNPMKAEFSKQIELLSAFAHLKPEWADSLNRVTFDLQQQKEEQKNNSATILARLLEDLCCYQQTQKVLTKSQGELAATLLAKKYQMWMIEREHRAFKALFANYAHFQSGLSIEQLSLPSDLFDCENWYMWGLTKSQLASAATLTGAATGAAIDMAVAGHSFMIGAIGGGLLGFASAWLGADKLVNSQLKGIPLGGYEAIYGPIKNQNFPYVIIGRFIYLHQQISQRNHALRETLNIESFELHQQIQQLEKSSQKALHRACAQLIKQKNVDGLTTILAPLF